MDLMSFNKSLGQGLQNVVLHCSAPCPRHCRHPRPSSTLNTLLPAKQLLMALGQPNLGHQHNCTNQLAMKRMEFKCIPLQISPKHARRAGTCPPHARLSSAKAMSHLSSSNKLDLMSCFLPPALAPTSASLTNSCKTLKSRGTVPGLTSPSPRVKSAPRYGKRKCNLIPV